MVDAVTKQAIYVNPAFENITGRTCASLQEYPLSYREIIHADDRSRVLSGLDEAQETGKFDEEFRITRPDGSIRWVRARGFPVPDAQGNIYRLAGVVQEVSARRQVDAAFRESEDRYRDLVENSQDLLCTHDLTGRMLSCNPAPARLLGYTVEELLQIPMREMIAPEVRDQFDEYLARIQRDRCAKGLLVLLSRTGERMIWEYHNTLRTAGLPFPIVRGMAHDVTERRRAEAALRQSEERFRVALKNSPTIVFNQDRELRYTWMHTPTLAWSEKDCLGKTDADLMDADDARRLMGVKRRVLETGVGARTVTDTTLNGKTYYFDLTIEPLFDRTGAVAGITCARTDITELHEKTERLQLLLDISSSLVSKLDLQDLFPAISSCLQFLFNQDFVSISVNDAQHQIMHTYPLDIPSAKRLMGAETYVRAHESLTGRALQDREIKFFRRPQIAALGSGFTFLGEDIQSLYCIPIESPSGDPVATLNLGSTRENAFSPADFFLMKHVAATMAVALDNARAYGELGQLNQKLEAQKRHLEGEILAELHFEEIIGESSVLQQCVTLAQKVAGGDSTVLILGETGTGKELLARAIHRMSKRSGHSFIKLNCAATPADLLEGELFGRENGGVPGSARQKPGRFELAENGTLFLDEVGEIPLAMQPKLLRVLQDHEFEKLGGTRTVRVNVRLIAATNRDLFKSMAERQFRSDLFYRLNIFPIQLPALRERRSDIPLLTAHFVQRHAARMKKKIRTIPTGTIDALTSWDWPGNVRELENFIERAVILTEGSVLKAPLAELGPEFASSEKTLGAREREHILRVLRETRGVLGGERGAAARLGLKRTTLQSKLHRLGISPEQYRTAEPA